MVVLAGEQRPRFKFGDKAIRCGEFPIQLFQQIVSLFRVGLFLRKIDVRVDVSGDRIEPLICRNLLFSALPFPEYALRGFLIAPEIGFGDARFQAFQALAVLRRVKDNSARA